MTDRPWNGPPPGPDDDPVRFTDWLASVRRRYGYHLRRIGVAVGVVTGVALVGLVGWVVATTHLGVGCDQPGSPTVALDHEYRDGTVRIRHDGGDTFHESALEQLEVRVDGRLVATPLLPFEPNDRVTVHDVPAGAEVRIVAVWTDQYAENTCGPKREQVAAFEVGTD